jgi:hypothetical protein
MASRKGRGSGGQKGASGRAAALADGSEAGSLGWKPSDGRSGLGGSTFPGLGAPWPVWPVGGNGIFILSLNVFGKSAKNLKFA